MAAAVPLVMRSADKATPAARTSRFIVGAPSTEECGDGGCVAAGMTTPDQKLLKVYNDDARSEALEGVQGAQGQVVGCGGGDVGGVLEVEEFLMFEPRTMGAERRFEQPWFTARHQRPEKCRRRAATGESALIAAKDLSCAMNDDVDSKSRPRRGRRGRQDALHRRQSRQRRCSREIRGRRRGLDRHVLRQGQRSLQRLSFRRRRLCRRRGSTVDDAITTRLRQFSPSSRTWRLAPRKREPFDVRTFRRTLVVLVAHTVSQSLQILGGGGGGDPGE